MGIGNRIAHAWNAFTNNDQADALADYQSYGISSFENRPGQGRMRSMNDRSIISSIYTRLSVDAASVFMKHIRKGENDRYLSTVKSGLNDCLTTSANLDQAATAFRQDIFLTLFDEGSIAIVPVETDIKPNESGSYDIRKLRVGKIVKWFPEHVQVSVYNELTGKRVDKVLSKRLVAVVENPLYSVMNEPNSILQRVTRKLQLLDAVDEAAGSGKLDLFIQLPYTVKSEARRKQAENRRSEIETQLKDSKYGIAYAESTEKITQLNRPAENNMLKQIEYLMGQLYGQLGLDETVFNGTADEATMLNYYNRTIEPVLRAVTESMARTFLSKTARTQGQTIDFQRDPFKLLPLSQVAEIADTFTRNEILSSNEVRGIIGFRPVDDGKSDQLVNSNMPQPVAPVGPSAEQSDEQDALVEETLAGLEKTADDIVNSAGGGDAASE